MPSTSPPLLDLTYPRRWLHDLPDTLDAAWIEARFGELSTVIDGLGEEVDGWIDALLRHNEVVSHFATVAHLARLAFRADTKDAAAGAEWARIRTLFPVIEGHDIAFLRRVLDSTALTGIRSHFGDSWVAQIAAEVSLHDPANAELGVRIGELVTDHSRLMGDATFTWRGEARPVSFVNNALIDEDDAERRAAHDSLTNTLRGIEPELQSLFDEAQVLRTQTAANAGKVSYAEYQYAEMSRVDWTKDDAAAFRAAVREHIVPVAQSVRAAQARLQGVDLVHPADVEIWPGTSAAQLIVPVEEIPTVARKVFDEMGKPFGESFGVLADYGLMDLEARPGKAPGGNCAALADQRVTFIYANQTGTPEDVTVLMHEAGHSLQKWRSRDIDLMTLRQPTLEACEIHSMTLELLTHPWAEGFFGDDADAYRTHHLRSQFLAVPYMAAVDDFQHQLYDPARESLTDARERGTIWGNLVQEYLPGIDWASTPWYQQNFWLRQHHITTKPFYYLDYALAQVVSWQLWLDSLDDRESAHERYLNLCSLGGRLPFRALLREASIGDPFDPAVVADVAQRIQPHVVPA